jgi:exosortase A-associated hydrolase 1
MNAEQRALRFSCNGCCLVGIVDVPERPLSRGVLVITGGPQYRVGSHRHYTLLARMLAARGIPVMRFDHRGMGDSDGEPHRFDTLDDDIRAAMKEFFMQMPDMKEVVIWGLCDAATAGALYACGDERVCGLVLLNPWLQAADGDTRATVRQYYLGRLGEFGFWKKVASGNLDVAASAATLRQHMRDTANDRGNALPQRVAASLSCFDGPVLLILSGDEAPVFASLMGKHHLKGRKVVMPNANRSFASRDWRDEVAQLSANWIMSW